MNRRDFLKAAAATAAGAFLAKGAAGDLVALGREPNTGNRNGSSVVYLTKDISPRGLMNIYSALGRKMNGRVAVKLSMGEPGGRHYLNPNLIKGLVQSVNGTVVDGNTAYGGRRGTVQAHMQTARDHGFTAIAPVDILDADGEAALPVSGGGWLREAWVGTHFHNYDSILVLSHFKGHAMAGFGGALKNIAIGIASPKGKCLIHTAGNSTTSIMDGPGKVEDFQESMAEAAEGMIRAKGPQNMLYINVMNNLSIDCDCDFNPSAPELPDIGILASIDPVAVDKACVDLIYASDRGRSESLRRRMEGQKGAQILTHAERLNVGRQQYTLVSMDG
jgi:uncharacterized Fe-S center protein